jgi:hypothetical protein
MASTKTDICNLALSEIGNEAVQITDFDTDTGKAARQCRLHYQDTLEELLRMHTWGCSKKRTQPIATVPSITSSDGDTFTDNLTTINGRAEFRNGADDKAIRWNSTSEEWEYGTWSDPTFTATFTVANDNPVPPETGWVPVAAGSLELTHNYDFGWDRAFRLPTDCIRPVFLTNTERSYRFYKVNVDWTVEQRVILSNFDEVFLMYLIEPPIATMDSLFIQAFYTLLASKLATPVAGDRGLKRELLEEFMNVIMPEARRVNGFEGAETPEVDSEWLEATNTSPSQLAQSWPPFAQSQFGQFSW